MNATFRPSASFGVSKMVQRCDGGVGRPLTRRYVSSLRRIQHPADSPRLEQRIFWSAGVVREGARAGRTSVIIVGPRLFQQSLAALLDDVKDIDVVGTCEPGDVIEAARVSSPDILILDFPAGGPPALPVLRRLPELRPAPRVVLIGRGASRDDVATAVELGVWACISEDDGSEHLFGALEAADSSPCYIGPSISDLLLRHPDTAAAYEAARLPPGVKLTAREREILILIAQAKSDRQVGVQLGMSPKTVHAHRTRIMAKLGVHKVTALVRWAIRLGLTEA